MSVEIREVDRADEGQVHDWWATGHAATSNGPVDLWPDWEVSRHALPQVDPENRSVLLTAYDEGRPVGTAVVVLPLEDNTHTVILQVYVPADHAGRGVGQALLDRVEGIAAADGRTTIFSDVHVPVDGENEHARWARARGYEVANVDGVKVVELAAHAAGLAALEARAAERQGDHRLVSWTDPAPEQHLASLARAMSRFLEEIPLGDLDLRPEAWTPERLRGREARTAAQRRQQLTVVALTPDDEVAGYTYIKLSPHAPRVAEIGDTLVLPDHRGHRLGLALKVRLHQQALALFPGLELIETGNATTNRWMNDVNEQLGYRVVERVLELQKVTA